MATHDGRVSSRMDAFASTMRGRLRRGLKDSPRWRADRRYWTHLGRSGPIPEWQGPPLNQEEGS
jgi:hypothetical protein